MNQTTHVNYARYIDEAENLIAATLFHPGEVILIDKTTNNIKVLLKGLNHPHCVKPTDGDSLLICDSDNNRVLEVDKNEFKIIREIGGPYSWVQDAIYNENQILIADADHNRIVSLDRNTLTELDSYKFTDSNRIYEILPITKF